MEITKEIIEKIHEKLNEVSPVDYDCGKLCNEICCVYEDEDYPLFAIDQGFLHELESALRLKNKIELYGFKIWYNKNNYTKSQIVKNVKKNRILIILLHKIMLKEMFYLMKMKSLNLYILLKMASLNYLLLKVLLKCR